MASFIYRTFLCCQFTVNNYFYFLKVAAMESLSDAVITFLEKKRLHIARAL